MEFYINQRKERDGGCLYILKFSMNSIDLENIVRWGGGEGEMLESGGMRTAC